jgi:hypothetical protein
MKNIIGCEKCNAMQNDNIAWQATNTGWVHDNCDERDMTVIGKCNLCDGVVRQDYRHHANHVMQHFSCLEAAQKTLDRKDYLLKTLTQSMVPGFVHVSVHTIFDLLEDIAQEGTCWLAYDHPNDYITRRIGEMQPELTNLPDQAIETMSETESALWSERGFEVEELTVVLAMMKMAFTDKLYWCGQCRKVQTEKFECDHPYSYGIDFSSLNEDMYN